MKFAEPKWTMGSALTVKTDPNKHLTGMVMPLKLPDSQGEGKFNLRVETVRPELPLPLFTPTILRENPIPLSSPRRPLKNRNPQPPINKVSPPAMKHRDLQPYIPDVPHESPWRQSTQWSDESARCVSFDKKEATPDPVSRATDCSPIEHKADTPSWL